MDIAKIICLVTRPPKTNDRRRRGTNNFLAFRLISRYNPHTPPYVHYAVIPGPYTEYTKIVGRLLRMSNNKIIYNVLVTLLLGKTGHGTADRLFRNSLNYVFYSFYIVTANGRKKCNSLTAYNPNNFVHACL